MNTQPRLDEFEAVALPHLDDLFRTAARVLGDRTDAADVVQEAYLQAWRSFHRFETGTNCRAWLYKILFHVIHHHRRRSYRMGLRIVGEGDRSLEETVAAGEAPDDAIDAKVLAALDNLPPPFRAAVLLVDVQEFTYREAAEALDVPIGTVMSRLSRGRRALRDELADYARLYGIGAA